jgi:hypothetical protein
MSPALGLVFEKKDTPEEHLAEAKELIARDEAGDRERATEQRFLHMSAAEHIATAMTLDNRLTQRKVAEKIGKSPAWVNTLIAWRARKYDTPTAFGPQAKAAKAARLVQTKHESDATKRERLARDKARAEAETAKAKAQEAKAKQREAKAKADQARAEARKAREKAKEAFRRMFHGGKKADISGEQRERLVKFLGMLGSDGDGERANAAKMADGLRAKIGVGWDQLIVEAA